ncbi:MAG: 2-isopropylmalate synthase [Anaerolineae bacterium]|nr:2-isopropylmalate synthase [Anaerolineae bacterium]
MDRVIVFDTTLRDGEQSPGAALTEKEKVEIAHMLELLGVDVIEAGFPISSPGDFKSVQTLSQEIRNCVICGLTRAIQEDIEVAAAALKKAARPRIHTGLGVSDVHLKHKFKMTREEALELGIKAVKVAKRYVEDVQYYTEDAGRADPEYLYRVLEAVIAAGATVINIPDTTGYTFPTEWGALIQGIFNNVPNIDQAIVSVHCHNDLGMATANSLAGVMHGARQVECTINGIGERAGNASLEEIVMALRTRQDIFKVDTGINPRWIYPTSRLVRDLTGIPVQPNKAIVGSNAFAHSSGIHQDGFLKERSTYEIINPIDIGVPESEIVLSARSGRHGLRHRLEELGYHIEDQNFDTIYQRFLEVADKKKTVDVRDLESIVAGESLVFFQETYELEKLHVMCGTAGLPTASVCLRGPDGNVVCESSIGNGPVDAAYEAIDKIVGMPNELVEFAIEAITEGMDAMAKVTVRIREIVPNGDANVRRVFMGRGADTDTIVAAARAYLFALNRLLAAYQAKGSRQAVAQEIKESLKAMHAQYGTAHKGDFMGWGTMREEELK